MSQRADTGTDRFSMAEMMAVAMARNLAPYDGKFGGVGAGASIPMAAVRLATLTVAPSLNWFCGGSGVNPAFNELPLSSHDPRAAIGIEAPTTMQRCVDLGMTGDRWDFGFSGGIQIDRHGNGNMVGIGPYERLKVRGPGSVGTLWTSTINSYFLFVWHHNPKVIVERVDYISSPGFLDGGDTRWTVCRPGTRGPQFLYTPMAVLDFTPDTRTLRLHSVNPGYTVDEVVANTGCELVLSADVGQTPPPTDLELYLLRSQVDRRRVLKDYRLTVG